MTAGRRLHKAATALATAIALAGASVAQSSDAPSGNDVSGVDIAGSWTFETDIINFQCRMTGELDVMPTDTPGLYRGRLVAHETCGDLPPFEAVQTCVLLRDGADVKITSKIVSVTPSDIRYWPDHFVLTIINGALMAGELRSADIAPARFHRRDALIG